MTSHRIIGVFLLWGVFLFGPQVVLAVGAALGGVGGPASVGDYPTVTQYGDAGTSTDSIEFTGNDCADLDAGTSPSGWLRRGPYAGEGIATYNNFLTAHYFSDCNKTRAGHLAWQTGATFASIRRTASLSNDFTIYFKLTASINGGSTYSFANRTRIFAVGNTGNAIACVIWADFAGTNWNGFADRTIGGVTTSDTVKVYPISGLLQMTVVLQKSGQTMRCWLGDESGAYHYLGGFTSGITGDLSNDYVQVDYGQPSATSFPAGNPIGFVDYIRVVNGNGTYFPW